MLVSAHLVLALAGAAVAVPRLENIINNCGEPFGRCYKPLETPQAVQQRAVAPQPMITAAPSQATPILVKCKDGWMTIFRIDDGKMTALKSDDGFMTAWKVDDGKMTALKSDTGFMTAWKDNDGVMTAWAPQPIQ